MGAVYNINTAHLSPFALLLVATAAELANLVFEMPTGVVADVYSRRLSIIVGLAVTGAAFVLWGAVPLFATILLAQGLWGLGYTFGSGATEAWISDEMQNQNMTRVFLRGNQASQAGSLLGVVVSVALGSLSLGLPLVVGGALFLALALFLWRAMPEAHFKPVAQAERNTWGHLKLTLREGTRLVRASPVLLTLFAVAVVYGLGGEGFGHLWEAHFLKDLSLPRLGQLPPVVWFGIINALATLLSIGAAEVLRRRLKQDGQHGVAYYLLGVNALFILSVAGFALAGHFLLALACYWAGFLFETVNGPLFTALVNQHLESRTRATVLSMTSLADSSGRIVGGPALGALASSFGIGPALLISAVVLSPLLPLYWRAGAKSRQAAPKSAAEPAAPAEG